MLLVDGDIVAYKAAYATEGKELEDAIDACDHLMDVILEDCTFESETDGVEVYLTGSGNFRYDYAVTAPYKGNRAGKPKPEHLPDIREHLISEYNAKVVDGEEADDRITIRATLAGPDCIIASVDKDFLQVPCNFYHMNKRLITKVSKFDGLMSFYKQILTGDSSDNIIGLKGIGPVKAGKILDGAEDELDMYDRVLEAYDGDAERVLENGILLWLRREDGQIWSAPEG